MKKKYDLYLAKSMEENLTIQEHTQMVLDKFDDLMTADNQYFDENLKEMIKCAIEYHDIGKANYYFQEKMRKHRMANEVPHGYLSALTLQRSKLNERLDMKDGFRIVLNAVYYHHRRDCVSDEIIKEFSEKNFKEQLDDFSNHNLKVSKSNLNCVYTRDNSEKIELDQWISFALVKGVLNRCDWSASGNLPIEISPYQSMKENILRRFTPNQLQSFMLDHINDNVALIASTGAGKTEAALLWLNDQKGFFTLPMKVSANSIYDRIKEHYLLPIDGEKKVAILHGDCYKFYRTRGDQEQDMFDYHNAKNLAFPLTVCTIDQIFKFAYKALGTEHLLATLKYSKVIIDELQAYSPDMLATIITALEYIHKAGGKFAIITATLPQFILDELSECDIKYQRFLGDIQDRHKIEIHKEDMMDHLDQIIDEARDKKVLVICNTVRTAQEVYERLIQKDQDLEVHLLHSRYTKKHRMLLEKDVIDFSKSDRSGICISTQIVEASLDIDFDVLYTYLSSIDSLIQRMGRVYRKRRNVDDTTNVHIFTHKDGIGSIYDSTIYDRTLENLMPYDQQMFIEEEKIKCMDKVYDKSELDKTKYMRDYKDKLEYLDKIPALQLEIKDVDNKFRNIHSIQILPDSIYALDEVKQLIEQIKNEKSKTERYALITKLSNYCINYTLYQTLKKDGYIDIYSCVDGEEIHRATCVYQFDEHTHKGVGLCVDKKDDEEWDTVF